MRGSAAPTLLPLGSNLVEAVLQPLALPIGGVGKPVEELVLLMPQSLAPLAVAPLFTIARRRRITRRGRISGSRIARRLGFSDRRRHRSGRPAAIADQLAV